MAVWRDETKQRRAYFWIGYDFDRAARFSDIYAVEYRQAAFTFLASVGKDRAGGEKIHAVENNF